MTAATATSPAGNTPFDPRSEAAILTLHPKAQPYARAHLAAVLAAGIKAKIIQGTRTYAEQNALYAQGRTAPGNVVTNAPGGYSNHNFGIAWDLGIWDDGGNYLDDSPLYDQAGRIAEGMGLEWGGSWTTIIDKPHVQIHTGKSTAQLRADVAAGRDVLDGVTLPPLPGVTWAIWLDGCLLANATESNPADPGHVYVPARGFLNRVLGSGDVAAYLGVPATRDALVWRGKVIPSTPVYADACGAMWAQLRGLTAWLGLDLTVDPEAMKITVSRLARQQGSSPPPSQ